MEPTTFFNYFLKEIFPFMLTGGNNYLRKAKEDSFLLKTEHDRGPWVAQRIKASAFGSGHDPRVLGSSPESGSLLGREPASPSPSACLSAYL